MKDRNGFMVITAIIVSMIIGCSGQVQNRVKTDGPEKVDFRVLPFNITDVKLLDGPFLKATQLDIKTLMAYEPDRLLAGFYKEAGLQPKATKYSGWENESLAGHSLGHYLSACSMMYQTTGDVRFRERVNYIVRELEFLQAHEGGG